MEPGPLWCPIAQRVRPCFWYWYKRILLMLAYERQVSDTNFLVDEVPRWVIGGIRGDGGDWSNLSGFCKSSLATWCCDVNQVKLIQTTLKISASINTWTFSIEHSAEHFQFMYISSQSQHKAADTLKARSVISYQALHCAAVQPSSVVPK